MQRAILIKGIPGGIGCPFWKPTQMLSELRWYEKLFGDYIHLEGLYEKD